MSKPAYRKLSVRLPKRVFDIAVSAIALVILAIPMLGIALLVRMKLGSPIIFRQERPGKNNRPFLMCKFRTMLNTTDANGELLSDAERLTPFGRWLRSTSLDELPELWNVLKGDMSLVGPRPLLTRYTPYYREREMLRLKTRPGITGWAQIQGRNTLGWDQRLEHDAWYVERMSFALDLRILLLTVKKVVKADGVVTDPASIMRDLDVERAGEG